MSSAFAQNYGSPSFYLIDSLDLSTLSPYDKDLLDQKLKEFHATESDTVQLSCLEYIVDNCWDDLVWPRYNQFLIHYIQNEVKERPKQIDQAKYNYFLAGAISNIGYLNDQKGDLIAALQYYQQALSLYEKIDNKRGISTSYNNLGVLYGVIGDTAKALNYHLESLDLKKELGDSNGQAMSLNNIGTLYEYANKPFQALRYYQESAEIYSIMGDLRGMAMVNDNVGDIYYKEELYGKALQYYNNDLVLWEELGEKSGISSGCNNIAKVYLKKGMLNKAEEFALRSYEVANELGYPMEIKNATSTLSFIYKEKGMFKQAYEMLSKFTEIALELNSNRIEEEVVKKGVQYEYDKIAMKDSLENAKYRQVKDAEIKEQKAQNFALYIGISCLVVVLLLGIRLYLQKRKDNRLIYEQKIEVESKNKEITDSITYAKRIQSAILPPTDLLNIHLEDGFVLYKPKDVVSGDFYWLEAIDDLIIFAVADCTGHGVPGAMVSVVCHNALNRSVLEYGLRQPAEILNKTRKLVIETFERNNEDVKDGMDIALCSLSLKQQKIEFSGANNSIYLVENEELVEIKGDKQPIGKFMEERPFTNHKLNVKTGTSIYLTSDGFADQFGGPNGKKFKYKPLKDLLFATSNLKGEVQRQELEQVFEAWKGNLEQVDDVCIMGIRI